MIFPQNFAADILGIICTDKRMNNNMKINKRKFQNMFEKTMFKESSKIDPKFCHTSARSSGKSYLLARVNISRQKLAY